MNTRILPAGISSLTRTPKWSDDFTGDRTLTFRHSRRRWPAGSLGEAVTKAGVIKFWRERGQTSFDVAETFALGQLRESQDEKLLVSGQFADAEVAVVASDTFVEIVFGQEVQALGEDGATYVHKVKNRRNAGSHPQRTVAKLKSKKNETAKISRNYWGEIAVSQILTGHYWKNI